MEGNEGGAGMTEYVRCEAQPAVAWGTLRT